MSTLKKVLQLAEREQRDWYLEDLYAYNERVIQNPFLRDQPNREMCEFFESALPPTPDKMANATQKLSMLATPRNTFKSTLGVGSNCEKFILDWKFKYDYDVRIGIGRSSRELAGNALSGIRQDFENNPILRTIVTEPVLKKSRFTNWEMRMGWRSKTYREPTISTMGLDLAKTGDHYDFIILDDLITEINYESERIVEDAYNYIFNCLPLLEPWGSLLLIGTRWQHNDPIGRIEREEKERETQGRPKQWNIYIKGCYDGPDGLFFPDRLSYKFLEEQRERLPKKIFAANYLNRVSATEDVVFKPEDIQPFDGEYLHPWMEPPTLRISNGPGIVGDTEFRVKCTFLIDSATTTGSSSDASGIISLLGDQWGRWWVWDAVKVRELPSVLIARICRMARRDEPEMISIETAATNETFALLLEQGLKDEGIPIPVYRYHPQTEAARTRRLAIGTSAVSKSNRIEFMQPKFSRGEVFIRRHLTDLMNELITYDGVRKHKHYDVLDALAQAQTLEIGPVAMGFEEHREDLETEWHDKIKALANVGTGADAVAERHKLAGRWTG